eukprot:gene11472-11568_t
MDTILKLHPVNIKQLKGHIKAKGPSTIHGDGNIYPHNPNWTPDSGEMNHSYNNAELSNANREEATYFKTYHSIDEVPDTIEELQDELIANKFKVASQKRSEQTKVSSNTFDAYEEPVKKPKASDAGDEAKAEKSGKKGKSADEPKASDAGDEDILIRRGFNIPAAGVVEETTGDEIINDHSAQPAAEIKPKPKIINVINQSVGVPASEDGVMMMFIKGVAIGDTLALDTPYLLTKMADVTALGITEALDITNGTALWYQLNKFYNGGLNDGALCWLVVTAIANNPYATYADYTQRAKMLGFCYEMPSATQSAADFPADVTATILALQTALATLFAQGFQLSAIVDGYMMSDTVTPAALGSLPNGVSDVGMALGQKFARITVGHSSWAVADGKLNTNSAYLTNGATIYPTGQLVVGKEYTVLGGAITYNGNVLAVGATFAAIAGHTTFTTTAGGYVVIGCTPVGTLSPGNADGTGDIDYLGKKQYMFMRTWETQSGFFWNDAATCTLPNLQISTQEFNRVANKLSAAALAFCTLEMGKNQPLDSSTGNIATVALNSMNSEFYSEYIEPMINSGDISDGSIVFTGPNFNALKALNFTLNINGEPAVSSVNVRMAQSSATYFKPLLSLLMMTQWKGSTSGLLAKQEQLLGGFQSGIQIQNATLSIAALVGAFARTYRNINILKDSGAITAGGKQTMNKLDWQALGLA